MARLAPAITTNTVEGYYSIFKRGMKGVYQHCSEIRHIRRDLAHQSQPFSWARYAKGIVAKLNGAASLAVCTENLSAGVVVVKSAQDAA